MNKLRGVYLSILFPAFIFAQLKPAIIWPLDSPRVITGNYGELRPNHFHAGLDFSTNGQVNLQVYAIEEGYVSRVRVSPIGYGKSIYITHRNGRTSLYGHLNAFSLKIDKIVKEEQYAKKSYEIDFYPKPFSVFVRKNEIIGLSGNTGGSSGPHLHFELRDELAETPLNPLNYYHVHDEVGPTIENIAFYNLADTSHPAFIRSQHIHHSQTKTDTILLNESILGFAFSAYDQFHVNGNHNNVYSAKLYLDDTLIYSHQFNHIDFSDHRFLNEFSETISGNKYQRCFLPTIYPPDFCNETQNKGRIVLKDFQTHHLKLLLHDESGNERSLHVYVKSKTIHPYATELPRTDCFVVCTKNTYLNSHNLSLFFPAGSLYYSTNILITNELEIAHNLLLQPALAHLALPVTIGFKVPENLKEQKNKLVLRGSHGTYTPSLKEDSVFYSVKSLGSFYIRLDTEAPVIKPHFSKKLSKVSAETKYLSFSIHDNLSGIGKYDLYINGQWAIAEYDAKSDALIHYFNEQSPSGLLKLKLEVQDKLGNTALYIQDLSR